MNRNKRICMEDLIQSLENENTDVENNTIAIKELTEQLKILNKNLIKIIEINSLEKNRDTSYIS